MGEKTMETKALLLLRLLRRARPPACLLMMSCLLLLWICPSSQSYSPSFAFFLDCGASRNTTTVDNRTWLGHSSSSPFFLSPASLPLLAPASFPLPSSSPFSSLLSSALVFPRPFSFSFPVSPGRCWIRLHFLPLPSPQFNLSSALFSVTAGPFTLLDTANLPSSNHTSGYLFKEYSINVTDAPLLLTFIPDAASNSSAFINALEVLSMPSILISDTTSPLGVNTPEAIGIPDMALETMYRVNVGGPLVNPADDTAGFYRTWLKNESFLYSGAGVTGIQTVGSSIIYKSSSGVFAPPIVYSTALQMTSPQTASPGILNISWVFPIDAYYRYVVRLHFCEINYVAGDQRVFNVYLQNQTAYSDLDLGLQAGPDQAYYRDFSLDAQGDTSLWVQVGPPPNSASGIFNEAILNGLEIWKLNNSQGSLDGTGVAGPASQARSKARAGPVLGAVIGVTAVLGVLLAGIFVFYRKRTKTMKPPSSRGWRPLQTYAGHSVSLGSKMSTETHRSGTGSYVSSAPSSLGRLFTFAEILDATQSFDEALVIGVGGFGKVYLGEIDDGTKVAVKRGNPRSEQGIMEFQTEIDMLSKLRHRHLVSLIGYCEEHREMILVYEYMANGPLRSHLYGSDLPPLSWKKRLEICIGAARGLHYLHTGAAQSIIHRDVKTTNILLDENLVAKVSDFGLSKTGPTLDRTHVTTAVKGSFGYLDPEYFRRQQLTEKSDVYSFGVVLLEVVCARPAINPALPRDQVNIAEWAMQWQAMGRLDEIIDPTLVGTINMESLGKVGETAEKCLAEEGISRPTIGDVLWNLEYALQLQETALSNDLDEDSTNRIAELPILLPVVQEASEEDSEDPTVSAVFSQLVNSQGR